MLLRARHAAGPSGSRGALILAVAVLVPVFGSALAAIALVREVRAGQR